MGKMDEDIELVTKDKPKSNKAKYLALLLIVLLALSITFIVLYVQEVTKVVVVRDRSVRVCMNESCIHAAGTLVKSMNRSVSPCDDFYEFACGGWNTTERMPDDRTRWQVFDVLNRELVRNLRTALTVAPGKHLSGDTKASATEKMQKLFQTCTDADKIKEDGAKTLLDHLKEYGPNFATWPFVDQLPAELKKVDLVVVVKKARSSGNNLGLLNNYVTSNALDSKKNEIYFDSGRFTLSRSVLTTYCPDVVEPNHPCVDIKKFRTAYEDYGAAVAVLLRARYIAKVNAETPATPATVQPLKLDAAKAMFEKILKLEQQLANSTWRPEDRDEDLFQNPATFAVNFTDVATLNGEAWVEIFKASWGLTGNEITMDTKINIRDPKYYIKLKELAENPENEETFINLLGWKVVEPFVTRIDDEFRAIFLKYQKVLTDLESDTPRGDTCVGITTTYFPTAMGSIYVRNFYRKEAKAELDLMIDYLMDSFRNIVKNSFWMDEVTRKRALEKAEKITRRLAYDDYVVDDVKRVDDEHEKYKLTDNFLTNFIAARVFSVGVEGQNYFKRNNNTDWITGSAVVNAFYSPNHNSISFPAGFLQAPFLGHGYPQYWNFAALGTVIGHEITHGFDDQGRTFDGDGILFDWWTDSAKKAYNIRADTIIKQYDAYNHLGTQLNGIANQGENIADNGGLKESYGGYHLWLNDPKGRNGTEEERLPGFEDFSTDQMFYLSYAQVWCGDYRPKAMAAQRNNAHSPGRFRVIGPLQNAEPFAKAYRCPTDTYMNQLDKKNGVW